MPERFDRGEILDDLRNLTPDTFASKRIFEAVPFVFDGDLDLYVAWKGHLGSRLEVDPRAVAITGSAGVGLSLNPAKSLASFRRESDVDIAVVSAHHFDIAWRHLRFLPVGPRLRLRPRQKSAVRDHRSRLIYWGTIATDRILEILPFAAQWLSALSEMAGMDPTAGREINARIYRDFDSLRAYQLRSVHNAREDLMSNEGTYD